MLLAETHVATYIISVAAIVIPTLAATAGFMLKRLRELDEKNDRQHAEASRTRAATELRLTEKIAQVDTKVARVEAKLEQQAIQYDERVSEWRDWERYLRKRLGDGTP